jgi:uncharacterized protein (DUF58 family)
LIKSSTEYLEFLNPQIISKISNLDLRARLVVEGFMVGLHKSPYHGFSVEFSQHRPYMQGDNLRNVDWRVFGKTDRYFIKQYEEETNLKCYIVLDNSKSMSYASDKKISKLSYASTLAAALSYLMITQQDAVSLTVYSDKVNTFLPAKSSQSYLHLILKELSILDSSSSTNTSVALKQVAEKIKRRGLIIILSDFFDDIESTLKSLKHFSHQKNEVIIFQILDPMERSFGFGKDAIFKDLETNEELTTQPFQIQKAYKEAMNEFTTRIKRECLNSNFDYNLIDTSTSFDKALFSYIQKRSKLH